MTKKNNTAQNYGRYKRYLMMNFGKRKYAVKLVYRQKYPYKN